MISQAKHSSFSDNNLSSPSHSVEQAVVKHWNQHKGLKLTSFYIVACTGKSCMAFAHAACNRARPGLAKRGARKCQEWEAADWAQRWGKAWLHLPSLPRWSCESVSMPGVFATWRRWLLCVKLLTPVFPEMQSVFIPFSLISNAKKTVIQISGTVILALARKQNCIKSLFGFTKTKLVSTTGPACQYRKWKQLNIKHETKLSQWFSTTVKINNITYRSTGFFFFF